MCLLIKINIIIIKNDYSMKYVGLDTIFLGICTIANAQDTKKIGTSNSTVFFNE